MRTIFAFVLGLAATTIVGAGIADAQRQPEPFPWERKTNRLLQPKSIDWIGQARRVLDRDIQKLNLRKNRKFEFDAGAAVATLSRERTRYDRLDANRDGFITRSEYISGRTRPTRAGAYVGRRRGSHRSRLKSRFRAADRDRDGKLSAKELNGMGNRRF